MNREDKLYRVDIAIRDDRLALLSSAKNLRNHNEFSAVYVNKDLTYVQRRENAKKRAAARLSNPRNSSPNSPLTTPNNVSANILSDSVADNPRLNSRRPPQSGGGGGDSNFH